MCSNSNTWSDEPRVAGSNPVGEEVPHCSSIGRAGKEKTYLVMLNMV